MWYTSKSCKVCSGRSQLPPDEKAARRAGRVSDYYQAHKAKINQYNRDYYAAHREELKAAARAASRANSTEIYARLKAKRQANPEHFKEIAARYEPKRRDKKIAYLRQYRAQNPEKMRQQRLVYYRSPKGKAYFMKARKRHQDSPQLKANKYHLLWIEYCPCQECGAYAEREVDHITPKAQGGSDDLENLRVLCFTHHRKSGSGRHSVRRGG